MLLSDVDGEVGLDVLVEISSGVVVGGRVDVAQLLISNVLTISRTILKRYIQVTFSGL